MTATQVIKQMKALPPRERGEVNQALKEKMPARYRRQIMLYYENLARVGLE